jgi:rare lipoprotein A
MNRADIRRLALCGGMLFALAGCGEDGPFAGAQADGGARSSGTVQLVERDVEAPDVFQVSARGLWDGRPSLGGVWVAHSDVGDPERVIIRNQENDKFVIGALFRRERELPGPAIQVSSDAAAALGMLAGQPADLNVTALRREEAPEEPEPQAAAAPPAQIEQDTLEDVSALAESAIERAEAPQPSSQAAPQSSPPAAESSLDRPYIQIGIFSVEANAKDAGDQMRAAGMVPMVREGSSQGQAFWRVIVGPARNAAERATLLGKVKELGFADAYAVQR